MCSFSYQTYFKKEQNFLIIAPKSIIYHSPTQRICASVIEYQGGGSLADKCPSLHGFGAKISLTFYTLLSSMPAVRVLKKNKVAVHVEIPQLKAAVHVP